MKKSWTVEELIVAVKNSTSLRQVLIKLRLKEAGGNYSQIKKYIKDLEIDNSHLKGQA